MTPEDQITFDSLSDLRGARSLPKGMRWLTTDDTWQEGDEFCGVPPAWSRIEGRTGRHPDVPILVWMLLYTPRGKR